MCKLSKLSVFRVEESREMMIFQDNFFPGHLAFHVFSGKLVINFPCFQKFPKWSAHCIGPFGAASGDTILSPGT